MSLLRRHVLILLATVSSLTLSAQTNEPLVRFQVTAHSFHSTLRDLEIDIPGEGRQPFFVPNRGFGTLITYQGPIGSALKFYRQGDSADAAPAFSLPVREAWQGKTVYLVTKYHSDKPASLRFLPVPLKPSALQAGSVYFCNLTQSQFAVKLGDTPIECAPGKHRLVEHVAQNGTLETILVELKGQEYDFLYRNGLRVRDDEFVFFFVLPDNTKTSDKVEIQMIRYPVSHAAPAQPTP